ncbi:putative fad binding domain protein [Parachaetomium inaequale]|uniref:Fad binding domain protein n=1 Tax=Parachaetomium inaequale TaxID=2588326 RepID=A0AAN6P721_9PEZI|nr:putative fad binding domain protein [Parachaetomium inaequale]
MATSASSSDGATRGKVIVVGAGPVGLFVALRLAQAGITVDVMEKDATLSDAPRAAGYYGGTLVALARAKVLEKAVDRGFVSTGLCWRKPVADDGEGGKRYGDIIARLPFPYGDPNSVTGKVPSLMLPQSKLAKLFFDEAKATGLVTVHFNMALTAIQDDGNSVKATFTRAESGAQETYQASFLVGADGGKSSTRKLLNIPFKGHSWPERLLAIDCVFETPRTVESGFPTSFIIHPVHFGLVLPLERFEPGKRSAYRCAVAIDPRDSRSDEELTSKESVDDLLDKMLPGPRPINAEVLRVAPYRIHQLCASSFRRGRCVLAGDAAHLNNPFGGMGLSSGLLDAEALTDSLDLIINEGSPLSLLDTYSSERQRVFQIFTSPVSTMNKLRCAADPELANEDWLIRALNTNPSSLKEYGRHFYDTWRTNMRSLVAGVPPS